MSPPTSQEISGTEGAWPLRPATSIEIRPSKGRGLGVFATTPIAAGDLIEAVPVLIVPTESMYSPSGTSPLANYAFVWQSGQLAVPWGFGGIYNHSYEPNAEYEDDEAALIKRYFALHAIEPGEEITINYNGSPTDSAPVGFPVV